MMFFITRLPVFLLSAKPPFSTVKPAYMLQALTATGTVLRHVHRHDPIDLVPHEIFPRLKGVFPMQFGEPPTPEMLGQLRRHGTPTVSLGTDLSAADISSVCPYPSDSGEILQDKLWDFGHRRWCARRGPQPIIHNPMPAQSSGEVVRVRRMQKRLPRPGSLSAAILPPWASTI